MSKTYTEGIPHYEECLHVGGPLNGSVITRDTRERVYMHPVVRDKRPWGADHDMPIVSSIMYRIMTVVVNPCTRRTVHVYVMSCVPDELVYAWCRSVYGSVMRTL